MSKSNLYKALHALQGEAPTLPKDKKNPHFKSSYTSLDTVVEKVGPLLEKHGLVWTTAPCGTHDDPMLAYCLAHAESGEFIDGSMPLLLDKRNAQGMGSALTYARRYSVTAVLNLVADEDDDGSAAAAAPRTAIIGEDVKPDFVKALASLTGAGSDDRDAILSLWKQIRGNLERPSLTVANVVFAIEELRARLNADPEVEKLRDDARRGYEVICKVTPGGAAVEYFAANFEADLKAAGDDVDALKGLIARLDEMCERARVSTRGKAA